MAKRRSDRPAGVPIEAAPYGGRWLLRTDDETRQWDKDGRLFEHQVGRLETRFDIKGRLASRGEYAEAEGGKRQVRHGIWVFGSPDGDVHRESRYEMGDEVARAWFQHGLRRDGAISQLGRDDVEVDTWRVCDETDRAIATIELGRAYPDAELLAIPAMREATVSAEELADLVGDAADAASVCAWIRMAARLADIAPLTRIPCRAERWSWVAHSFTYWHDGEPTPLRGGTLGARLAAARWGTPWSEVLEDGGAWLFEHGRPHAALDFLEVAALFRGTPSAVRVQCLRALDRDDEAAALDDGIAAGELRALLALRSDPRGAAGALADAIEVARGSTALAVKPRARLLRAYAAGRAPTKADVAQLKRSIPKALRESIYDDAILEAGFVDGPCGVSAEAFLAHVDDAFRIWPRATELTLMYASGVMARIAACAALARYTGLSLVDTYLFGGGAAQLATSRFIGNLEKLGLYGTNLYDDDLQPILAAPHLGNLRELELGNPREDQNYTLDGLRPIANARFASRLEYLGIAKRYFDADVVPDVIARLPALRVVDLEASDLGEPGIVALAALPHRFTGLSLQRCGIDAAAMRVLAASPVIAELTALDLGGNPLGEDGLVALARSPYLGNLATLGVGGLDDQTKPTGPFVEELARGAIAESIAALAFGLGRLGPRGAHAIASRVWPNLQRVELYGNRILDDGAIALFQSPALATIRYLDLGNNDLTDASGQALAESPYADALTHVELGGALFDKATRDRLRRRFGARIQFEYPWARR